jgi:hypothetical protein
MADNINPNYTNIRATEYNNKNPFDSIRQKNNGYNIGTLSYPAGLGVQPDLQHYVTFFINVRSKSKFVKDNSYKVIADKTGEAAGGSVRNTLNPQDNASKLIFGLTLGLSVYGAGKGLATAAGKILGVSNNTNPTNKPANQPSAARVAGKASAATLFGGILAAVAGGGASSLVLGSQILQKDSTQRLIDVITLQMQEKPSVTYGINYQDKDLGILGGFLGGDNSAADSVNSTTRGDGLAIQAALKVAQIPSMLPGMGGLGNISDIVQFGAKVKTNPFREVFFEGVDYRKFNFRYKFMPKNKGEVLSVYNIISKFKEHMHPELAAGGAFFVYPSEFEIAYYYNNKENGYFNKIATCALTDLSVDYGGEQFSSFSDGAPTEINLTLSFRELELITKESIRTRGY